ncbi:MAG: iron dependent repressor, metal binding and dimerization domain protein, partial [Ornithinimicrobium sp.]
MTDLIDTTEMYLKAIYELIEDGVVPMRARIAERLDHSGPTVSQTVARMERDGLLHLQEDRRLLLTDHGQLQAVRVMRKHRLAERLLIDVIGLEPAFVHEEACRWEHVMSDRVETHILTLIAESARSPYGNPIPGLEELGGTSSAAPAGGTTIWQAVQEEQLRVRILRIGEPAQVEPESLGILWDAGITPGAWVDLAREGDRIRMSVEGAEAISVPEEVATHVFT